MGITVYPSLWVMQDLYHQPFPNPKPYTLSPKPEAFFGVGLVDAVAQDADEANPKWDCGSCLGPPKDIWDIFRWVVTVILL